MSVVYIHIGLPKTGTTYLQDRLWRNRDSALAAGLLYPGDAIDDHFHAAVHLQPERYLDWVVPDHARSWPKMIAQMKAWSGISLVSHELLTTANREQIAKLVGALDFADEINVVVTVRDLARQLPSAWQENLKNQRRGTFDEFVTAVIDSVGDVDFSNGEEGPFWEFQDYIRILDNWLEFVSPERIHVVTVPRDAEPKGGLWERFVGVLGVDPMILSTQIETANSSLSASQAEFLRQLNYRLQPSDIEWARYESVVKGELIGKVMFSEDRDRKPQGLNASQRSWVARQAETMTSELARRGYNVVGSLDDLTISETEEGDAQPPTQQEVFDSALDALAGLVKIVPVPTPPRRWELAASNVVRKAKRRVVGVSKRVRHQRLSH